MIRPIRKCWRVGGLTIETQTGRRALERVTVLRVGMFALDGIAHRITYLFFERSKAETKLGGLAELAEVYALRGGRGRAHSGNYYSQRECRDLVVQTIAS